MAGAVPQNNPGNAVPWIPLDAGDAGAVPWIPVDAGFDVWPRGFATSDVIQATQIRPFQGTGYRLGSWGTASVRLPMNEEEQAAARRAEKAADDNEPKRVLKKQRRS